MWYVQRVFMAPSFNLWSKSLILIKRLLVNSFKNIIVQIVISSYEVVSRWRYSATKTLKIFSRLFIVGWSRDDSLSESLCHTEGNGDGITCSILTPRFMKGTWSSSTYPNDRRFLKYEVVDLRVSIKRIWFRACSVVARIIKLIMIGHHDLPMWMSRA